MKINLGYFSIMFLLFASLICSQELPNSAKKLFNEGNKYLKTGNYENAVNRYQEILKITKDYRVYYQLGIALKKQSKLNKAEEAFNNSIKANPEFDLGYNGLGSVYFINRKYSEAVDAFKKFLQLAKKDTSKNQANENISLALLKLAELTKTKGNFHKAIEYLNEAIGYSPNDAAYILLATTYFENGEYEKTLSVSDQALALKNFKLKGTAYYYKGMAYKQKHDRANAKENFLLAQKDPQYKRLADYELNLMK